MPKQKELCAVSRNRVNVEKIEEDKNLHDEVWIDTELTEELREKGMLREFIRGVQDARKKEGLKPVDRITLQIHREGVLKDFFEKHKDTILSAVHANNIVTITDHGKHEISLGGKDVFFSIIHNP